MSSHRMSTWFILFFWTASMSWLVWTKLRPAATLRQPPLSADVLPLVVGKQPATAWQMRLNGDELGWIQQRMERFPDGQGSVDSLLRIERLRLDHLVSEGFGGLGALIAGGLANAARDVPTLNLTIRNAMQFDYFGQLQGFECSVTEDDWGECIRLQGTVREEQLHVKAYLLVPATPHGPKTPVYSGTLPLPPDRLVGNALSPSPKLAPLRVGQHWTFDTYNPLTPTHPLQTIAALVEDRRVLRWGGEDLQTFHVVYQRTDDDGLSLDRDLGELWVAGDGTVMKQSAHWGQLKLEFELMADDQINSLQLPSLDTFPGENFLSPAFSVDAEEPYRD